MILLALNTYGHENGWVPIFIVTQSGRNRNPIKCTKMIPSDQKLNAPQGTGLESWIGPLVFPRFWNEITKNVIFFTKFHHFFTFTYTYDVIFRRKYAKPDIIRSHVA